MQDSLAGWFNRNDRTTPGFVEASVAGSSLRLGLMTIFTRKDQISGRLVHHSDRRKLPDPAVLSGKPLVAVEALPAQTEASPSDPAGWKDATKQRPSAIAAMSAMSENPQHPGHSAHFLPLHPAGPSTGLVIAVAAAGHLGPDAQHRSEMVKPVEPAEDHEEHGHPGQQPD